MSSQLYYNKRELILMSKNRIKKRVNKGRCSMLTGVAFALIVCFSLGPQVSILTAGHHQQKILWLPGRRP